MLELNGNVIDYEGIGAIAEALTQNTSLKTLGLRWANAVVGRLWSSFSFCLLGDPHQWLRPVVWCDCRGAGAEHEPEEAGPQVGGRVQVCVAAGAEALTELQPGNAVPRCGRRKAGSCASPPIALP